jgi:carbon monoxide dehydrogenase subunit G
VRTTHSITVPLAPATVFAFLSDVANETQWRQSIVGSRYVDAAGPALGVHGETDVAMGAKSLTMRWVIAEFSEGTHVAWELDGDPWHGGGSYTVTPEGDGARVRAALEVRLSGPARLMEPLLGLQLKPGLRKDLERLRALLPSITA